MEGRQGEYGEGIQWNLELEGNQMDRDQGLLGRWIKAHQEILATRNTLLVTQRINR